MIVGMEYVYAALLLHKAGKEITEDDVKKVVEAAGVKADDVRIKALVAVLDEVDIDEVLKSATAAPVAQAVPAPVGEAKPVEEEEEKEEEKEEKKEEEALEGLAALFG